jgi:hypothetical protein
MSSIAAGPMSTDTHFGENNPMTDKIKIVHLEGASRRIDENTKIVRYMKLETLLLLLFERRAFIPSHATLGTLDRLETGILFDLPDRWKFWENWVPKIADRLGKFALARAKREGGSYGTLTAGGTPVGSCRENFRKYIAELAIERCIWCWNEFTNYSHALWKLYGNRGVAIISTVGEVKNALIHAGVERGVVAPITYLDSENCEVPNVLTNEENIFRPYFLKSVAYEYEKEIRFVLAARREIVRDKGGVLVTFKEADFFKSETFPYSQREERLVVKTIIDHHLNKSPEDRFPPSSDSRWTEVYSRYNGTPFTTQDSLPSEVFSDMR